LLVVCGLAVLAGCSSSKPPAVNGQVTTDARVNQDPQGRALPVVVRVFELKSTTAFEGADFFSIYEKEGETLGADVVWRQEFQLRPGEVQKYQRPLSAEAKFVGAVAAFRDLSNSRWRSTAPVPVKSVPFFKDLAVLVAVQAQTVTVTVK
jgi:type VI secretion system protein VasD